MKAATPMMVALRNDPLASAVEVQYFQQDGHSSHSPLSTESSPPSHHRSHSLSHLRTLASNFKVRVSSSLVALGLLPEPGSTANHTG